MATWLLITSPLWLFAGDVFKNIDAYIDTAKSHNQEKEYFYGDKRNELNVRQRHYKSLRPCTSPHLFLNQFSMTMFSMEYKLFEHVVASAIPLEKHEEFQFYWISQHCKASNRNAIEDTHTGEVGFVAVTDFMIAFCCSLSHSLASNVCESVHRFFGNIFQWRHTCTHKQTCLSSAMKTRKTNWGFIFNQIGALHSNSLLWHKTFVWAAQWSDWMFEWVDTTYSVWLVHGLNWMKTPLSQTESVLCSLIYLNLYACD